MASAIRDFVRAGVALLALASSVGAEVPEPSPSQDNLDTSLSPECRVPGSKLYTLGQLSIVRAIVEEKRPLKVLALGPTGTGSFASGSSSANYPSRLAGELAKVMPGVDLTMEHRSLPGEITADSIDRFTAIVTEIEPNLVVWQVGTNDTLAKADVEAFTGALNEMLAWLTQHDINVILIEPPFTRALASDDHFKALIAAIQTSARDHEIPLVLRSEALRFLSQQRTQAGGNAFRLSELGYRCMAEHVARTITLSIPNHASSPQEEEPRR